MVLLDSTKIKQIFVYGDNRAFNIALIVPNNINDSSKTILEEIELYSANKLKKYEIPKKILIVEPFSVENKLLTPKMSMIRKNIYELYKNEIEQLYQ